MSRIKGITIELDGDTRGLDKALSDVNKRSRDVQSELRQVDRLLKFNPGNTELVAQKQKLLGDQVETTREKLNRLKDAEKQVQEQFKKGEISEEQYRAFQREIVETESKLKHYESQLEQTQSKLDKFGDASAAAGEKLKSAGKKMTDTGKSLSKKVTAPLMGAAAIAVKVGSDFEAGMSKVAAISQASGEDLEKLTDKAREMGAKTSFSATEAANGLEYMALAGWETEQMLNGIEPILHLAEAGALDLGRASDLVTDSMAALSLEVDDLDGYLDRVAQTAANSNTDIDALMEAMVVAGGTFSRFNVPLEEANAFLGVLANRGTKGSEAGTALNAIMDRLTSGTGQASKALEELGISAFDSEGNFKGMEAVMLELQGALSGLTEEEKAHYQSMIAGLNHGKSFEKMMQGLGDEYYDLKADIEGADGALIDMRNTMKDNLQGRMEEMRSGLEEVGIIIYDNIKPAVEMLVEWITKLAGWFQTLSPAMQNTIVVIAGIAAAIGPLLIVLGLMAQGLGAIMVFVPKLIAILKLLGVAIGGISLPVVAIIAGIAALIAIGVLLWKNWDTIREFAIEIWGHISDFLADLWETIGEGISTFWEGITEFFEGIWEVIKNIFLGAFIVLGLLITGKWDEIGEVTSQVWKNITDALAKVWEGIKKIFTGAIDVVSGLVKKGFETIKNTFNTVLNWIDDKTGGKFKSVTDTVRKYMQMVWDNIKAVWDYIKNSFKNATDFIKALVTGDFKGMKDAIKNQMDNVKDTIKNIWDNIMKFFKGIDLKQVGIDIIKGLVGGIKSMATSAIDAVKGVVDGAISGAKKLLGIKSPSRVFMEIGEFSGEGLVEGLKSMGGRVKKAGEQMTQNSVPDTTTQKTDGGTVNHINMQGLFNGANFNVRSDQDIEDIAKKLHDYMKQEARSQGVVY